MSPMDFNWLDAAIPPTSHEALNASVREAVGKNPTELLPIFREISSYIVSLRTDAETEPAAKKRKLDTPSGSTAAASPAASGSAVVGTDAPLLTIEGISFSVPQRKKYNLVISKSGLAAVTPATGKIEFAAGLDDLEYICCLPVPDKAARQWNFCLIPNGASGIGENNGDAIVFTIPDGAPKTAAGDAMGSGYDTSSYRTLLIGVLNDLLKESKSRLHLVEEPDQSVFFSMIPQSHRKGERAFHVKAHRGSKEGYLFFLRHGILSAFKKPLVYFSFGDVDSISYTSITKRTFNLNIKVAEDRGGGDFEFSMIDQEDYTGIDAYIKENRLNDASMTEARRAKLFHVNGKKGEGEGENPQENTGELAKAWEDAEDEEEEDYVPGQEDDDGGSGSESGSEDSGSEDGSENMESDEEGSIDLQDELGSEMEDVDADAPKPKRTQRVRA